MTIKSHHWTENQWVIESYRWKQSHGQAGICEQKRSVAPSRCWGQKQHGSRQELLGWAEVRVQGLSDRALSTQTGLTAHWVHLLPLVCRELQGAAPAEAAVTPRELQAVWGPCGGAAAPQPPAQAPLWGGAPAGQTHQCGTALLQLLWGGGQDGQGGTHHTRWRRHEKDVKVRRLQNWLLVLSDDEWGQPDMFGQYEPKNKWSLLIFFLFFLNSREFKLTQVKPSWEHTSHRWHLSVSLPPHQRKTNEASTQRKITFTDKIRFFF